MRWAIKIQLLQSGSTSLLASSGCNRNDGMAANSRRLLPLLPLLTSVQTLYPHVASRFATPDSSLLNRRKQREQRFPQTAGFLQMTFSSTCHSSGGNRLAWTPRLMISRLPRSSPSLYASARRPLARLPLSTPSRCRKDCNSLKVAAD
jgi:hypothetical protein